MLKYKIKLWTPDGRVPAVDITARDEVRAAAAAVPHFGRLGEDVANATSIDIVRPDGTVGTMKPQDVLDWRTEHSKELPHLENEENE